MSKRWHHCGWGGPQGWEQDPREQQERSSQSQSVRGPGRSRIQGPAEPLVLAGDQKVNTSRDPSTGRQGLGEGRAVWRAADQGNHLQTSGTGWSL